MGSQNACDKGLRSPSTADILFIHSFPSCILPLDKMPSQKPNIVSIKLSDRVCIYASFFNEEVWYHLKDLKKQKSVSITKTDMATLFAKRKELAQAGKQIKKMGLKKRSSEKRPKDAKKKSKKTTKGKHVDDKEEKMDALDCASDSDANNSETVESDTDGEDSD